MSLADAAIAARLRDNTVQANELLRRAYEFEKRAAEAVADQIDAEPTRSVLHRSAATLAIECGEVREAERLIAAGLAGNPPAEIAEELRDLFERVNFQRHLSLRGLTLEPGDIQLSISGRSVGYGIADSEEFVNRVQTTQKLIYRTVERTRGVSFRETGPTKKTIREDYAVFLTVPRAASFAVTFKLGRSADQLRLPETTDSSRVIDEFLECLDLYNQEDETALRQRFVEEAYYDNFVGLARRLAPDGEAVSLVGFTAEHDGKERQVAITKRSDRVAIARRPKRARKQPLDRVEVTGELRFADSRDSNKNRIILIDANETEHSIIVPKGLMADIVKPLWENIVRVSGNRIGTGILLEDIDRADS